MFGCFDIARCDGALCCGMYGMVCRHGIVRDCVVLWYGLTMVWYDMTWHISMVYGMVW